MLHSEFSRALSMIEEGRLRDGKDLLTRITEQSRHFAAAQVTLARVLSEVGTAEDALNGWSRAERLAPFSPEVQRGLAAAARDVFVESAGRPAADSVEDTEPTDAGEFRPAETPVVATTDDPMLIVPVAGQAWDGDDATEPPSWYEHPDTVEDPDESPADELAPEWDTSFGGDAGDGASSRQVNFSVKPDSDVELDRLIGELESARIVPSPNPDAVPSPDLSSDIDDVVSETLARIYATQKQFGEAARVYERLALETPDRAEEFRSKASEMRQQE